MNSTRPDREARERLMKRAATEYRAGDPLRVIGRRHGRSYSLIRNLLIEAGVTLRRGGAHPGAGTQALEHLTEDELLELRAELAKRYVDGLTVAELSLLYAISRSVTRRLLLEAEVPMRPAHTRRTT